MSEQQNKKSINIIISFKDRAGLLHSCLESIFKKTSYQNYEVILVNNESNETQTLKYLKTLQDNPKISIIQYKKPFNFSAINNLAVKHAKGEFILFLNNDTEVISPNWLDEMLQCFEDESVGVVGAKLLYPDNKIQHTGIVLSDKFVAANAFGKFEDNDDPKSEFNKVRKWNAVTAACMMTRKSLFEEVGGFDEKNLAIAYNDVDYCLKIRKKGFDIIYTPFAKLYHYESASRGLDIRKKFSNRERHAEFLREQKYIRQKWSKYLAHDQFLSPAFLRQPFWKRWLG